jgi:hypothetical protein
MSGHDAELEEMRAGISCAVLRRRSFPGRGGPKQHVGAAYRPDIQQPGPERRAGVRRSPSWYREAK